MDFVITKQNVFVTIDGTSYIVPRTHCQLSKLLQAIEDNDTVAAKAAIDIIERMKNSAKEIDVIDGVVYLDQEPLHGVLNNKLLLYIQRNLPIQSLVLFTRKLRQNPLESARERLYECLKVNNHPITDDGYFLAYKAISTEYKDLHTGLIDNSIGATVTMDRSLVNEDPEVTCSHGLHVASHEYAMNFYGGNVNRIVVEVLVDPADVVSVPRDYHSQKMRVCRYKVIKVHDFIEHQEVHLPYSIDSDCYDDQDYDESESDHDWEEEYEEEFDKFYRRIEDYIALDQTYIYPEAVIEAWLGDLCLIEDEVWETYVTDRFSLKGTDIEFICPICGETSQVRNWEAEAKHHSGFMKCSECGSSVLLMGEEETLAIPSTIPRAII